MSNVGTVDRIIRIMIGLAVLSLLYFLPGNDRYWGLIGIIPLLTGIIGLSPFYRLLGINTCRRCK